LLHKVLHISVYSNCPSSRFSGWQISWW